MEIYLYFCGNWNSLLTKQNILNHLKNNKVIFAKFWISKLGLFGSYVKNKQKQDSDIDIFFDFYTNYKTYDNYIETCFLLDNLFKENKVDIVTINGLSPFIWPKILKEVEYAYENTFDQVYKCT